MKNKPDANIRVRRTYIYVGLAFLVLVISLQTLIWLYWDNILEPRLRRGAESQANVLAHSQAVRLADALIEEEADQRLQGLHEAIDEVLLFSGPESDEPLFLGLDLEIDYDVVSAPPGSLNVNHGVTQCRNCFVSEVALYSPFSDELIGIARFRVSDSFFQHLSKDVQKTLFTQSRFVIVLLLIVWGVIVFLIKEINRSRHLAEIANKAKSTFLANMSHELRTPLNAILGFSQIMAHDSGLSPKNKEYLAIVNRSSEHLLELINDVLELSRIEAAQSTLTEATFDLYDTLENVVETIRPRAEKKNLQLFFQRADLLPRFISSDERKLRQILLNLLGNAVKFTREGGVTLRVQIENGDKAKLGNGYQSLRFKVEDTGPGVTPEESTKIFDEFTQARSGQIEQEGTGLGLAISRQFVNHLGGELSVGSVVGQGTVFMFTIRFKSGRASEIEVCKPTRRVIGLKDEKGKGKDQPYRILIADDHPDNRTLLRGLLEEVGFAVKSAENGQQALELNDVWKPHLIWMDIRMPLMDGYEATEKIRSQAKSDKPDEQPVIIALTASVFEENRAAVLAAGCDDFVRRPFREADIFDKMQEYLDVDYIFEEAAEASAALAAPGGLSAQALRSGIGRLPRRFIEELKAATELSDMETINQLVNGITVEHEVLANELKELVESFQYDLLLTLLEDVEKEMGWANH